MSEDISEVKQNIQNFRKLVGKFADLDFVTAPHLIPSENPDEQVTRIT